MNQLHQLATDPFTSGDTNWTQLTSTSGWDNPTYLNGSATGTSNATRAAAIFTGGGVTFPNDQWASMTVEMVKAGTYASVGVRNSTSGAATGYYLTIGNAALGSATNIVIQRFVNNVYTQIYGTTNGPTVNEGDVMTLTVVGTTLSAYQNGNLIGYWTDSGLSSGAAGFQLYPDATGSDAAISGFSAGGFSTTIGGNVGVSGVTVSDGTNTTTSDANGNFILSPEYGTVTITPSLRGYSFSPGSSSETVSGAPITVNFTATPASAGSSFGFVFKLGF